MGGLESSFNHLRHSHRFLRCQNCTRHSPHKPIRFRSRSTDSDINKPKPLRPHQILLPIPVIPSHARIEKLHWTSQPSPVALSLILWLHRRQGTSGENDASHRFRRRRNHTTNVESSNSKRPPISQSQDSHDPWRSNRPPNLRTTHHPPQCRRILHRGWT